jgi:hypothetical protein
MNTPRKKTDGGHSGRRAYSEIHANLSSKHLGCTGGLPALPRPALACVLSVSRQQRLSIATVADALDDLAVPIHLTQLALSLFRVAPVDHQVVDYEADARLYTEAVFR